MKQMIYIKNMLDLVQLITVSENGSDIKDAYIATVSFMADDGFTAR